MRMKMKVKMRMKMLFFLPQQQHLRLEMAWMEVEAHVLWLVGNESASQSLSASLCLWNRTIG